MKTLTVGKKNTIIIKLYIKINTALLSETWSANSKYLIFLEVESPLSTCFHRKIGMSTFLNYSK